MSSIHNIAFLVGRIIAGGFFLMNGFNHFAQLNMMTGYAKSKGIPAPALAVGGSGVLLFYGWTEPAPWVSPDHRSGTVGDFPSGCLVRHPQFLDGSRPTSKAGGDGQLPKKHGHTRSAANDLGHPAAVADESRSLIRDNCRKSPFHSVTLHQGVLSEMAGYVNYPCRRQQALTGSPLRTSG